MKRTVRVTVLFGALLALSMLVAPAVTAGTYVDKKYGYRIKLPQGWTQTPTQPDEETEVAKFKDDRKREFATLSVFRFTPGRDGATTPDEVDEADEAEDEPAPRRGPRGMPAPDRAWEYLKYHIEQTVKMYGAQYEGLSKPRKIKAGKVQGQLYTYEFEHPRRRSWGVAWIGGIFARDGEEYLLLFAAPKPITLKKLKKTAYPSIKSFRFAGDKTKDAKEEDVEKKGKAIGDEADLLDPEKRARIKKALVGTWKFIDTPHYIVVYNCDRGLADYIARRLEWMRVNAYEKVFPPVKPIEECMVIRVCKEADEFRHYSGMGGGVLGYWYSLHDELVFPDLSPSKRVDPMTIGVMNHEGFHQYINYCLFKNDPPVWFNEGFAEFFYCVKPAGKTKMGFEKRHPMRFGTIKSAAGSGNLIPAKDFVRLSHRQYMQQARLCYAQGWAFATWLKRVTRNERYRQIPDIFFRELQKGFGEARGDLPDGAPPGAGVPGAGEGVRQKALEAAFEGIDMDKLHDEFVRDLKKRM